MDNKWNSRLTDSEATILGLFPGEKVFGYHGHRYQVLVSGKPIPNPRYGKRDAKGEPKTDVYLLLRNLDTGHLRELKISHKKPTADFIENKLTYERMLQIFGNGQAVDDVLHDAIRNMRPKVLGRSVYVPESRYLVQGGSYCLGYRLDIVLRHLGELSMPANMPDDAKLELITGSRLVQAKRDALVHNREITGAGVANAVLSIPVTPETGTTEVLEGLQSAQAYASTLVPFFKLSAVNYRSERSNCERFRLLLFRYEWEADTEGMLIAYLKDDMPLRHMSSEMAKRLVAVAREAGIVLRLRSKQVNPQAIYVPAS